MNAIYIPSVGINLFQDGDCTAYKSENICLSTSESCEKATSYEFDVKKMQKIFISRELIDKISMVAQKAIGFINEQSLLEGEAKMFGIELIRSVGMLAPSS